MMYLLNGVILHIKQENLYDGSKFGEDTAL